MLLIETWAGLYILLRKLLADCMSLPDFISTEISYGLFLSDHNILTLSETELVVMPNILCQDLSGPAMWHIRGCIRAGINYADTELVQQAAELVATFAGKTLHVGRATDIRDEMHT